MLLQQYLPFTVLKHHLQAASNSAEVSSWLQQYLPFTVLKPFPLKFKLLYNSKKLQQYLPFTVLKLNSLLITV